MQQHAARNRLRAHRSPEIEAELAAEAEEQRDDRNELGGIWRPAQDAAFEAFRRMVDEE